MLIGLLRFFGVFRLLGLLKTKELFGLLGLLGILLGYVLGSLWASKKLEVLELLLALLGLFG